MENIKVTLDATNTMRIGVPITKVDEEKRTVAGFATLNNVDKHGDVIDAEGSRRAFEKFRGNIREMHMPIAVGKMVSFDARPYVADDGNVYEGIWVEAKVSKGAQDTWEKVLDKTLSGFSIGANARADAIEVVKGEDGSQYRLIKDYDLFELSLVDSPANPLANVFSFQKADNGEITSVSGLAVEAARDEAEVEAESQEDVTVEKFINKLTTFLEKRIGGNDMSDKATEETVENEAVEEETVEKAADVSEVEVETEAPEETANDNSEELVNSIVEKVLERLNSVETAETDEVVTADEDEAVVEEEEVEKSEDSKSDDALAGLIKELADTVKSGLDTLNERVENLETSTAVRKSADVEGDDDEEEDEEVEKFWGNSFTGARFISADSL